MTDFSANTEKEQSDRERKLSNSSQSSGTFYFIGIFFG